MSEDEEVDEEKRNQSLCNLFFFLFIFFRMPSPSLWARYERFLDEYPLLGRSLTAASIAGASEAMVQVLSSSSSSSQRRQRGSSSPASSFQARRVALWVLYGGLFSGPVGHGWQKLLSACFAQPKKKRGRKLREEKQEVEDKNGENAAPSETRELALRVAADALVFGPLCNAVAIAFIALALERRPASAVPAALRSALPATQLRAWRFWPLVSLVAYSRVPPKLRVPFFNCAGFLWGVILISGASKGSGRAGKRG